MSNTDPTTYSISIAGDSFARALQSLEATGQVDAKGADDIRWLYNWAKGNSLSLNATGREIGVDASTVHRVFTANYGAGYSGVVKKIHTFRELTEARESRRAIGFVETSTWRKVEAVCMNALTEQMPAFIYGASQIGKTTCLEEFARRHNHGQTKYLRMPACCTFGYFVKSVARACYINQNDKVENLRERIMLALNSRNLLIIDELHQALVTVSDRRAAQIMEFIREIYDRTRCGIVLAATKVGETEIESGRNAGIYDQLRRRGMTKLVLPDTPPASDIKRIAAEFGLEAPQGAYLDAVKEMLRTSGLGMYVKYLQSAASLAHKEERPVAWDDFGRVWDGMRALSTSK